MDEGTEAEVPVAVGEGGVEVEVGERAVERKHFFGRRVDQIVHVWERKPRRAVPLAGLYSLEEGRRGRKRRSERSGLAWDVING